MTDRYDGRETPPPVPIEVPPIVGANPWGAPPGWRIEHGLPLVERRDYLPWAVVRGDVPPEVVYPGTAETATEVLLVDGPFMGRPVRFGARFDDDGVLVGLECHRLAHWAWPDVPAVGLSPQVRTHLAAVLGLPTTHRTDRQQPADEYDVGWLHARHEVRYSPSSRDAMDDSWDEALVITVRGGGS